MSNLENALVWLYVKTWGQFGDHVIKEKGLWNFGAQDLETAIMGLAYPRERKIRENEKSVRVKALNDLIMEKFDHVAAFHEWSHKIHQANIENLPETVKRQHGPVKILKWDPGKYLFLNRMIKMDATVNHKNVLLNVLRIVISCICDGWYI